MTKAIALETLAGASGHRKAISVPISPWRRLVCRFWGFLRLRWGGERHIMSKCICAGTVTSATPAGCPKQSPSPQPDTRTWKKSTKMPPEAQNPTKVLDDLRGILAVDKLPIGFLLGAGCPCSIKITEQADAPPFIPDSRGLTEVVMERSGDMHDSLSRLNKVLTDDGQENPTIEHMLTRVRTMKTVVGNETIRGFSARDLKNIDQHICKTISAVVHQPLPKPPTPYHLFAKWIGNRTTRSVIFTTNYDLLIEQALESLRVPFFDGFIGSDRPFFSQQALENDNLPSHWALLCKLHGSINWRRETQDNDIVRSHADATDTGDELLIYPSHLKYTESRRMPYFVMLDQLKDLIENKQNPAALFIVGYSFSDEHINDVVADSLQSNQSAVCYAFQYGPLSDYHEASKLAERCSNLHVIARDQALSRHGPAAWVASLGDLDDLDGMFVNPIVAA